MLQLASRDDIMPHSMVLRHSSHVGGSKRYLDKDIPSYPDGAPVTEFENRIAILNQQAFPSALFAYMDDILVYALFASKRRQSSYRMWKPDTAFQEGQLPISKEDGLKIRHIYGAYAGAIANAAQALVTELPNVFNEENMPILQQ